MLRLNKFTGEVKDGKFVPDDALAFVGRIKDYESQKIIVEIKKWNAYKQRSLNQNAYWHSVICGMLSEETGHTPEEIHEILKFKFLVKPYDLKGKTFIGTASTANLSTSEFENLCSKVRAFASLELGIYLPNPNEAELNYL